jgi:Heterokaryon incompatibility protein (HET)
VGPEDGSVEPRLLLSQGRRGRYATLSYCWGGPQPFTLNQATLDDRQQGIAIDEMPAVFQDAVNATRLLGLQYLWIDALCIIQDSDLDKAVEMAVMDRVYYNAFVTICAANSAKCSSGFLQARCPRSVPHTYYLAQISFPCPDGPVGSIFLEVQSLYYQEYEFLSQRGWALQERLLSPRVITFGFFQMLWQCQGAEHCDGGSTIAFNKTGRERLNHQFFQQKKNTDEQTELNQIYDDWLDVVKDYSRRQLTFHADILPALSGVATRFGAVLGDTYCAGLWRNDIRTGLTWRTEALDETKRSPNYRAPTWSWASIDGQVYWSFTRRREVKSDLVMRTKIVSCEVQPLHQTAQFGEVKSGVIQLHGIIKSMDWDGSGSILWRNGPTLMAEAYPDLVVETLKHDAGDEVIEFHMGRERKGVNSITRPVSCVPITDECSLMLEHQQDGNYSRIGVIDFSAYPDLDSDGKYFCLADLDMIEEFYEDGIEGTISIV